MAEVLAAAVAQASKEFYNMCKPKITKLKGGYSTDAELVFCSWCMDILVHIHDHKLDNKVAIQLIKDQTQDSAWHEVEFQLDLCGWDIWYQDLLDHLSIAFQGGGGTMKQTFWQNSTATARNLRNQRKLLPMSYNC